MICAMQCVSDWQFCGCDVLTEGAGIDAGNTTRPRSAGSVGSEACGDGGCGRRGSGGLIADGVQGIAEL